MRIASGPDPSSTARPDASRFGHQAPAAEAAKTAAPSLWDAHGADFPIPPVRQVKFGIIPHPYCGVCPICVAGAAARMEVNKIGELRKGEDIEITVEEASRKIRGMGKQTGAKVGRTSIGNEDGTRLQPLSEDDLSSASIAALPRLYTQDKRTYTINGNPQAGAKGTDNGTYKFATSGQQLAPGGKTFDYSCQPDAPPPPLEKVGLIPDFKPGAAKQAVRTYGIYHHIAEGDDARFTKRSQPLLLGYSTFTRLQANELLVISLRELPRFERLGVEAGGLMNLLGAAAKQDGLDSVTVAVEPWQTGIEEYLTDLKDKYHFNVQPVGAEDLPKEYIDCSKKADHPGGTKFYRIPLAPLKATLATLDTSLPPGEFDTQLLRSIEMPDAIRDGEDELVRPEGRNLETVPPVSRMTFLTRKADPDLTLETEAPVVPKLPVDDYQPD